ncbi:hypothetical protein DVH05_000746 [Phytophthora capsici]|nr:hypothetical protein DVH05_000743 [Phytophthora capsici]KAG1713017.1 hypothetical protein DVH05_000746 [Phytophthora capsici]
MNTEEVLDALTANQRVVQREKGTKAPSVPLDHYFLTTEFARTRHTKSTRCTSGQKKNCLKKLDEFNSTRPTEQRLRKTGNVIDVRQYVKKFVNDRVKKNLDPSL